MGLREELQKRIEKKQQEINELQLKIREAEAYMQGLQDTIRLVPKEQSSSLPAPASLRPGTAVFKAKEAIRTAGKPLHISQILIAIGKSAEKKDRVALSGTLAAYVRKEAVFTRPAPNTFGLVEFGGQGSDPEPPGGFGLIADVSGKLEG